MTERGTREVVAGHICSLRDAINTSPHLTTNLRISYTRANLVPVTTQAKMKNPKSAVMMKNITHRQIGKTHIKKVF